MAYRFLVEKNKKLVYSIAMRVLGNEDDAADAAQESFLRAYQQLGIYAGKSRFSTWLYTITYRICVSRLQSGQAQIFLTNTTPDEDQVDVVENPHEKLTEKEQKKLVKEAVEKLAPLDALLVTLYYFDENSINEIAQITELTASNIKIKLFRARKILEQELKFLLE